MTYILLAHVRVYKGASNIASHFKQSTAIFFHFLTGIMRALPLLLTLFAGILISSAAVPEGLSHVCSKCIDTACALFLTTHSAILDIHLHIHYIHTCTQGDTLPGVT